MLFIFNFVQELKGKINRERNNIEKEKKKIEFAECEKRIER